ncbi:PilZ domain-containing protein [Parablastomonas sp. CN1-191]|uniref:PilZ domain-containing protein n=1 Tax=Parablastomonas sp. CN1-191 TaxID=3400908 RepID=UPI003BF7C7F8
MNVMGQRQLVRDSLLMIADVRLDGVEGDHQVRVRNLSIGGMMAVSDVPAQVGQALQVALPRVGWIDGTVAWRQDGRFGIAFGEEIDAAAVRSPIKPGEWAQRRRQTAEELAIAASQAAAEQF